ncbi:predicted protein, partial [Nematostella vectensis]
VILDEYQEQPHLLDPYLEDLVGRLLSIVRDESNPPKMVHQAFKYIYVITKVRGPKCVVRLFTHEVSDIEPLLAMINKQNQNEHETWETRYILLLWLSIACMIPFDMSRLDGTFGAGTSEQRRPVVDRIIDVAKSYMCVPDKSRDAAALLISKFITRPDVKKHKLAEFIDWSLKEITKSRNEANTIQGMMSLTGLMTSLALLLKHGKREDLLPYAPVVLKQIGSCGIKDINNTVLRKLNVKLVQRLGLTFMKPRLASWRYQRGSRSLVSNLQGPNIKVLHILFLSQEEEYDVPEEIEDVVEQLLIGLKDKDTVVRWSAAKGIGRITGRLPKELADEVVGSLLELFTFSESDGAWHGGCLALAELGRRGLLLPQRLPEVVPVVLKALAYDERRGSYSVGNHVRDAACYVCWSFARAYDPKEIRPHVLALSSALIVTTLFDREVNCRRAASAAFQENVGRQGTFPHGIEILTTADYHSVGNRSHTYLNISVYIAQFKEYTRPMIENLVETRLQHWDGALRELAARALHNLTSSDPEYMATTMLPKVLTMTSSMDLFTRHGSIFACAEIVSALYHYGKQSTEPVTLDNVKTLNLVTIIVISFFQLHAGQLFRGLGGEFMRQAISHLIEKLSLSQFPWQGDSITDLWQRILYDNLCHTEPPIQVKSCASTGAKCNQYYRDSTGKAITDIQEKLINHCVAELKNQLQFPRVGYAQALGSLPKFMLMGKLQKVVEGLIIASQVGNDPGIYAESRNEALKSLASVACTVGIDRTACENDAVTEASLDAIYKAFFEAMQDYTTDSRGDVGAWVREASMTGLAQVTKLVLQMDSSLLNPDVCQRLMCCLVQQASEKIDRTRAHAGEILVQLVHHDPRIPHIPHHEQLLELFKRETCSELNWSAPADCFPVVTRLLGMPTYRYPTLLGLTVSVGGLTESLVRQSTAALLSYLRDITSKKDDLNIFADTIINIFREHKKNDRVIVPLFKMLDFLLSSSCFEMFIPDENHGFPQTLVTLTKEEIARIGDARKIITSINVFCQLLQFPGVTRSKSMQQLLMLLCHKFPRVRKTTADQLYTTIITYDDRCERRRNDHVFLFFYRDMDLPKVREERNKICDMLDMPRPVLKVKSCAIAMAI